MGLDDWAEGAGADAGEGAGVTADAWAGTDGTDAGAADPLAGFPQKGRSSGLPETACHIRSIASYPFWPPGAWAPWAAGRPQYLQNLSLDLDDPSASWTDEFLVFGEETHFKTSIGLIGTISDAKTR